MAGAEVVRELIARLGVEFNKAQFASANTAIEKVRWQMEKLVWSGDKGRFVGVSKALGGVAEGMKKVESATATAGASLKDVKHHLESLTAGSQLGELGEKLQRTWDTVKLVGKGPTGIAAGFAALGLGLAFVGDETAKMATTMARSATRVNMDVIAFQEIAQGAENTGTSIETVNGTLGKLGRSLFEAGQGNKEALKSFSKLGIGVKDATGKIRPTQDVLYDLADKFKAMPEGAERGALAMKVLGRGGLDAVPWLSRGSAALKKFADGARAAGVILSRETIAQAKAYAHAKREIAESFEGFKLRIGAKVLPGLLKMAEAFEHWLVKIRPVVNSGLDTFMQSVTAACNTARVALYPVTQGLEALTALLNLPVSVKGGGLIGGLIAGFKAVAAPLLTAYKAIEDLVYYVSGKGSRLGLSMAIARGKGKEYVEGRKAGKSFDMLGNVIEPKGPDESKLPQRPGSARGFGRTAEKAFDATMMGGAYARMLAANRAGDTGAVFAHLGGVLGSMPTMVPEALSRGLAGTAERALFTPSAGAAGGFANPEYDWRNPQNGPQVSTEPRLAGFAPAGEWEKSLPLDVNVHVTADEGLKVQADQHLKKELRKAGR